VDRGQSAKAGEHICEVKGNLTMPLDEGSFGGGDGRHYSSQDAANVLYFLRQAEIEGEMWQGIRASEAFESACLIIDIPPDRAREALGLQWEVGEGSGYH